ncbi:MAG: hypothetical protein HQK89_03415 [Nitrospirae bacterium]|nr:hypothetical protein [Nitrospirota bacterium]
MSKILLPACESELQATGGRLLYIARALLLKGHQVDIMTYSASIFNFARDLYKNAAGLKAILVGNKTLNFEHVTSMVNTYIKLTYNLMLPQTDLKLYKVTAFDDFRGHLVNFSYPDIDVSPYQVVILPMPSIEMPPLSDADIFVTTVCFHARSKKIPIIGIHVFPVTQTAPIYLKTIDYVVIKEEWEKAYLEEYGFDRKRTYTLNYAPEEYFVSPIEDRYLDSVLNPPLYIPKEELAVMIINHPRLRFCIKEILEVVGPLEIPKTVFFLKRKFVVRELSEEDLINGMYMADIKKIKGRHMIVESDNKGSVILNADVIISPSYLSTLGFASGYGKHSIVYNPLIDKHAVQPKVTYVKSKKELMSVLLAAYEKKKSRTSLPDVIEAALKSSLLPGTAG